MNEEFGRIGGVLSSYEFRLFFPLYNKVNSIEIGVPEGASFKFAPISNEKPIVLYGTSIAQGACASRPGMAWGNILQRKLEMPVVNFGFSGNGQLDEEFFEFLAEIDAKIFLIDCMPNMTEERTSLIFDRMVKGVNILREKSKAPILLVEHDGYMGFKMSKKSHKDYDDTNKELQRVFKHLKDAGVPNIFYLSHDELGLSMDAQVDGVHATDLGMQQYANAYEKKIREILGYAEYQSIFKKARKQRREANNYEWNVRHEEILAYNKTNQPEIVMIGNSITHFWGGEPAGPFQSGPKSWKKLFKGRKVVNLGFGWDRTENVMWRIAHGELDGFEAKKIFMMIGTNNLYRETNEEIVDAIKEITNQIKIKQPKAEIYVVKILPRRDIKERLATLNTLLEKEIKGDKIKVIEVASKLVKKDGKIDESLFHDGLHPNEEGYKELANEINKYIK